MMGPILFGIFGALIFVSLEWWVERFRSKLKAGDRINVRNPDGSVVTREVIALVNGGVIIGGEMWKFVPFEDIYLPHQLNE